MENMRIEEEAYVLWLYNVEGVGDVCATRLVQAFGSCKDVYYANESAYKGLLKPKQIEAILAAKKREAEREYEKLLKQGITFYSCFHEAYPKRLQNIPDQPFGIFVKGKLPNEQKKSVAIIGARDCSEYGRYVAGHFAEKLAESGVQIISGMARGIDGIAQESAIRAGGNSFGVLGCGVDICYPPSNQKLYRELIEKGGIISSYLPGTEPSPKRFPPRNRIISGLADAVLVVEARQKSGTLITVDMALEQGRDVYVVPGRITDRLSDGCNKLIGQGAGVALSPDLFLEELLGNGNHEMDVRNIEKWNGLLAEEKEILKLLDLELVSLEQIRFMMLGNSLLCNLTLPRTMEILIHLSLLGFIRQEGAYYGLTTPLSYV